MSVTHQRVVVAMSGGVDSSVAAALLVEQGFEVIGMMMRLWNEPGAEQQNRCCTPEAMSLARRVAASLDIPFYVIDAKSIFQQQVVDYFIDGYTQGVTPNPCLVCNRHIRWEYLLNQALNIGAQDLATGHYARLSTSADGSIQLLRAVDRNKDQSYILHILGQSQLAHASFPLGEYTKPQVRELARKFNLPVAERAESQDLCFLGQGDYRSFLQRNAPQTENPGPILDIDGKQIGEHDGLAFYTIGQRKGLKLAASLPMYVIEKDLPNNALIVGPVTALGKCELTAANVHWVSGKTPLSPLQAEVKIRYKAPALTALVTPLPQQGAQVVFDQDVRDITPGQACVFYNGENVLGGGIIQP